MTMIPPPRQSAPMVIGTGYHRNSEQWEPTVGGESLQWWRQYLTDTELDRWYAIPDPGKRALQRAFRLLHDDGLYIHFGVVEGVNAFVVDRRARWGHRMRNG